MLTWLLAVVAWLIVGIAKLRYFDRNREGDWLLMLSDKRNRRCSVIWVFVFLLISWLTWPIAIFSSKICLTGSFFRLQWRYVGRR